MSEKISEDSFTFARKKLVKRFPMKTGSEVFIPVVTEREIKEDRVPEHVPEVVTKILKEMVGEHANFQLKPGGTLSCIMSEEDHKKLRTKLLSTDFAQFQQGRN